MPVLTWEKLKENIALNNSGSLDLDQMIWARLTGVDYPLTHYDEETFWGCRDEEHDEAFLSTSQEACMGFIQSRWPGSMFKSECDGKAARVEVALRIAPELTARSRASTADRTFDMKSMSLYFVDALIQSHAKAIELHQKLLPLMEYLETGAPMKEWDIEELDGGFVSVSHEAGLCGGKYKTAEKAREYADITRHNAQVLISSRNMYKKFFPDGGPGLETENLEPDL